MTQPLGVNARCPRCRIFSYIPHGETICYHCLRKPEEPSPVVPVLTGRPSMDELRKMLPVKTPRRKKGAR